MNVSKDYMHTYTSKFQSTVSKFRRAGRRRDSLSESHRQGLCIELLSIKVKASPNDNQGPGWECKWSSTKHAAALPEGTSRVPPSPPWRGADLFL